jgi:hypothetical protein
MDWLYLALPGEGPSTLVKVYAIGKGNQDTMRAQLAENNSPHIDIPLL